MFSDRFAGRQPRLVVMSFVAVLLAALTAPTAFAVNYFADPGANGNWTSNLTWRIGSTTGPNPVAGVYPGSAAGDTVSIASSNTTVSVTTVIPNSLTTFTIGSGTGILVDVQSGGQLSPGTATINSGGTLRVNSGGTILNVATTAVNSGGVIDAQGGTLNGGGVGSITINPSGQFQVTTSTVTLSNALHITNAGGTITVNGTDLAVNSGAFVTNSSGSFNVQSPPGITSDNVSTKIDVTGGSLVYSGSGTATVDVKVNTGPSGSVSTANANLLLNQGGTHQGSLACNTPGGRLNLAGATTSNNSTWTNNSSGAIGIVGGTLTLIGTTSAGNIALDAGTIQGAGTISPSGSFTWNGGDIIGTGAIALPSLSITGATGAMNLQSSSLLISGSATYVGTGAGALTIGSGGKIQATSGTTFDYTGGSNPMTVNASGGIVIDFTAAFNANDDSSINGAGSIDNAGGFIKNGGTSATIVNCKINNSGTVSNLVSNGTITLNGGGTHGGTFDTTVSATKIIFGGGTHVFGSGTSFTGQGLFVVDGATFDLDVPATIPVTAAFAHEGGVLTGAGSFSISGPFTWSGGTMDNSGGSGVVNLGNVSTITGSTASPLVLSARTLNNNGILDYSPVGSNYLSIDFGGKLQNNNTFTITGDFPINTNNIGTPKLKHAAGTMTKTAGLGTASINPPFELAAPLTISNGSIAVFDGGISTSSIAFAGGTNQFLVSGGTFSMNAGTTITGLGAVGVNGGTTVLALGTPMTIANIEFQSGTINGANLVISGSLLWQGGSFVGPGTTTINASVPVTATSPTSALLVDNRTFDNNGNFSYSPNGVGFLTLRNVGVFNNKSGAGFTINSDGQIANGAGANSFNNAGTVTKSGGAGGFNFNVPLTNANTFGVTSGTMIVGAGGSMSAGAMTAGAAGTSIDFFGGTFAVNGGTFAGTSGAVKILGSGTLAINQSISSTAPFQLQNGGTLDVAATKVLTLDFLNWTGGTIQNGGKTVVDLGGTIGGSTFPLTLTGGHILSIEGPVDYDADATNYLTLTGATSLMVTNGGSLSFRADGLLLGSAPANFIVNNGTATKTLGSGASRIETPVSVTGTGGTIGAVSGTLHLKSGGGTLTNAVLETGAAAKVQFENSFYTIASGSSVSGTGTIELTSGTLSVTPNLTFPVYNMNGGTLTGAGNITAKGGQWTNGAIDAGGTFDVFSASTFNVGGASTKILRRNFTNNGTVNLTTNTSVLQFENGITFTNNGNLDFQSDAGIGCACAPVSTLVNNATRNITKSGGSSASNIAAAVNNDGNVTVSTGGLQLNLNNGGTHSGSFSGVATASIGFSGTHTFAVASSFSGSADILFGGTEAINGTYALGAGATTMIYAGTATFANAGGASTARLLLNGGTLAGAAAFTINGTPASQWLSGTITGTGPFTVNSGSTFQLLGTAGPMLLDGRTLTNNGSLTYTSTANALSLDNAASIVNGNAFQLNTTQPINVGTGGGTIQNNGTFSRVTTAGGMTVAPAFSNAGTVSLQAGTTTFNSFTQTAGTLNLSGGNLASGTTVNINSGDVTGAGTITANLSNGGNILPGAGLTTGTITIAGTYQQVAGGKLEIDIKGPTPSTQYDVLAVNGQPSLAGQLKVNLINAFVPTGGQTFDVFTYGTQPVTDFTTDTFPSFGAGGFFTKAYQPANLRLTAVVPTADVSLTNVPSGPAFNGDNVTFTVTITNNDATYSASSVALNGSVSGPATLGGAVPSTGSCTGLNCTLGNIAPGASEVVTYTFTATGIGTINLQVSSTSTTTDPNAANNTNIGANITVSAKANVFVGMTDSPDPVNAAQTITYNVAVTNGGPNTAANAAVALSMTNGSITGTTGGAFTCTGTGASASCTTASLAVGTGPPITVTVQAGAQGTASLTATYTSTTFDSNTANNTATEPTAITPQADLSIVKSGPASTTPGTLVYTVTVTNNGPSDASGVSVTDPTPAGATFVSNSGDCTAAYPCAFATITNGQSKVITSTYAVPPNGGGTITNVATVSASTADPNGANNSSTVVTPVNQTADLAIVKSGPASIVAGAPIVYTLTITNNGPSHATSVNITDPTPAGLTFVSNSGACTSAFPCVIASITSGASVTITSTFNTSPALATSIANTAGVSSGLIDSNGANNSSTVVTTVTQSADVQLTKSGPASAPTGPVVYTITVTNAGPSNATAVTVNDPTPAGFTFVSNSGACTTAFPCNLGVLAAGSVATITTTFNAGPSTSGNVTNTATVTSSTSDSATGNNTASATTTINAQTDLQITKTGPASVLAGTNITYTIAVKNLGPADATSVTVSDPTPAGFTFAGNSGACSGSFPCVIPTITAGATATISSTFFVSSASGTVNNTATVSFGGDTNTANNTSTFATTVQDSADLSVTKTGPATAPSGTNVDYNIVVKNNGPSTAAGVVLSDPTPAGATLVSVIGACSAFPCNLPTLTSGQSIGVSAKYLVTAGSGGSITNVAGVTATTPDPNGANNSASATTATDCITTAPTPFTPANNATNVPTTGRLTWDTVAADFYSVYLGRADQNGCNQPFGNSDFATLNYSGLAPNTKYAWRVEALVNNCPIRTSACVTFTTGANCNTTITLVKPLGGTQTSLIEFEWQAVTGATEYTVFAKSGNGNFLELGKTTSTKLTASLASDGTAQWFVVAAIPGCGNVQSATATFTLCNRAGIPLARVVGQATSSQNYRVEWDDVPNAIRYEVDEATNADFIGATTTSASSTFVPFRHDATTTPLAFHYRVRAFSACTQLASENSPPIRIIIIPLPKPTDTDLNTNVPAGSTEVVVQQVFIPGVPGVSAFFNAIADRPWLSVRPPNGVLPPEGITLEVIADPRTLPNGTFTATVIVTITTPTVEGIRGNGTSTTSKPISISLVTPVTPVQTQLTPSGDSLIIPSVGHLDGVNSHWQSDIRVTNTGFQNAKYALTFTPSGGTGTGIKQTTINVGPGETTALDDIIKNWFGIGSLGDSANGMLEIRSGDAQPLTAVASSRTYNVTANGTLGQFIPALPFSGFVGKALQPSQQPTSLSMQQISQSSAYRTNVGIVEASGNAASVLMSVFNSTGTRLADIPLNLKGGEQRQLNSILATNGITLADGRIEVKVTGGDGKVTAYASVVDNATNDPLLVSGVATNRTGSSKYVLPGVADLTNALANWRTDMRIFNTTFASQNASLTLHPLGGGAPLNATITLQPGEVRTLDDVVKSLFKASNVGGAVHVETTSQANLVVTGRTYNQTSAGTFGQFIEAVTPEKAVGVGGKTLHVLQVEDSTRYRTNLGIAEVSGRDVMVEVQIVLPDSKVTPTITFPMAANEFRQLSVIRDQNLGNIYNARLAVRVVDGQGRITAYGSVVDMTTQDPTYVPAQ